MSSSSCSSEICRAADLPAGRNPWLSTVVSEILPRRCGGLLKYPERFSRRLVPWRLPDDGVGASPLWTTGLSYPKFSGCTSFQPNKPAHSAPCPQRWCRSPGTPIEQKSPGGQEVSVCPHFAPTTRNAATLGGGNAARGGRIFPAASSRPDRSPEDHDQTIVLIDNPCGSSYIHRGNIPVPPSSGHLRFPMLWAHLKVPHRGLPRASARREAAYPSRTLPNA
jgi:hypothetical protein